MIVKDSSLVTLKEIFHAFPTRTPHRLQHIQQCLNNQVWNDGKDLLINANDGFASEIFSSLSIEHLISLDGYFGPPEKASPKEMLAPIVLVPKTLICCKKPITIDSRHADVVIYTDEGMKKGMSFHGVCKTCKNSFYCGFIHNKSQNVRSFLESDIFIIGSGIGFSSKFLRRTSYLVYVGAVAFETCAEIYNSIHALMNTDTSMNPDRLETGLLLFQIVKFVKNIEWHRKEKSKEIDLERIAEQQYPIIRDIIDAKWISHSCNDVGCRNRFIVLDGNEKLFRLKCDEDGCINNPIRGNQFGSASTKCAAHNTINAGKNKKLKLDNERLELRPITRSMTGISDILTSGEGCKEENTITKFHDRSAGMIYIFRPCGIRLTHCEMITHESLTQIFKALVHCFGKKPTKEILRGIIYDRSCDLKPFLDRLGRNGDAIAQYYAGLEFIVDIFHVEKHTLPKCTLGNPACVYHPHLPQFQYLQGVNTEVAEQSFHKLNKHKSSTRKMCYAKRLLHMKFLDDVVNANWVLKHSKNALA